MMARSTDYCKWLEQSVSRLSECWAWPDVRIPKLAREWLGPRDWWWSGPVPAARRVAIVSSRLPRLIDPHGTWLRALRAALARVRDHHAVAVVGHESAGYEFVLRGIARQGGRAICLHCCDLKLRTAAVWARRWRARRDDDASGPVVELWALPPQLASDSARAVTTGPSSIPERDRAAIAWADEIIVLGLRTGGNLHTLLRHRLHQPNARVLLADLPSLQSCRARDELLQLGAILWSPTPVSASQLTIDGLTPTTHHPPLTTHSAIHHPPLTAHDSSNSRSAIRNSESLLPLPSADVWDFLTHATRACVGPWPGQSRDDYIDSLLDARADADHSPLAALLRIVIDRRLAASRRTIRGRHAVVSFTAVPLAELPRLRVFRSHRGRWDFEPYGICIRGRWLEQHSARPVVYGDESVWSQLAPADRPYFQLLRHAVTTQPLNNSTIQPSGIDWSIEQEWRHVGDLDLRDLPAEDALLFVPTSDDAQRLLAVSPWPVTVLPARSEA